MLNQRAGDDVTSAETTGTRQATQTKQTCARLKYKWNVLFECNLLHLLCSKTVKLILLHLMHEEAHFCNEISSQKEEQSIFWRCRRQKFSGLLVIWHCPLWNPVHFGRLSPTSRISKQTFSVLILLETLAARNGKMALFLLSRTDSPCSLANRDSCWPELLAKVWYTGQH